MGLIRVVYGRVDVARYAGGKPARSYTYNSSEDMDVAIGDIVQVPPTKVSTESQEATVVGLDSDYQGEADWIIGVVERAGSAGR